MKELIPIDTEDQIVFLPFASYYSLVRRFVQRCVKSSAYEYNELEMSKTGSLISQNVGDRTETRRTS